MKLQKYTTQTDADQDAYRLGYCELGEIFSCFSHLLLRHARKLGSKRLAFVARDGDLLMRCTARLLERIGDTDPPDIAYVHISRQTSLLPALGTIQAGTLRNAFSTRSERTTLAEALTYLGMPLLPIRSVLTCLAIEPDRSDISPSAISRLVADEQFQAAVQREVGRQRALLYAYLAQEDIGTGTTTLLVDIGWRGSILTNLMSAFLTNTSFTPPAGAFLGLWSEDKMLSEFPVGTIGLLADIRKRRNVLEASAWFAAFLLEAVCRANEGTTIGYECRDGKLIPLLAGESASRRAEQNVAPTVAEIQRGIFDYIDQHAATDDWLKASDEFLRACAQRSLLRLACFPRGPEIGVATRLIHTEGHMPNWWSYLIHSTALNPLTHPRRWLAGLASPWRTGYIRHTGGAVLSTGFLALESALLTCSPYVRALLTQTARSVADKSFRISQARRTL